MPITAALSDGSRVKARMWVGGEWRDMVGSRERPDFWCPFCEGPMHPKTSRGGLQFFAHNPNGPDCRFSIGGAGTESALHMRLKDYVTAAIDGVSGWEGMPEHRVDVDDGHFVADVYAARTDGKAARPGVFEVQLSRESDGRMVERQTIRSQSGAVTTWLTRTDVPWFRRVPSLRLDVLDSGRVQIVDGLMKTDEEKSPAILLERFIAKRLAGHYAFVENVGIIRRGGWVTPASPERKTSTRATGGSDDCSRVPSAPAAGPLRPRPAATSDGWTMNITPDRHAIEGEVECKWLGCPAPADRRLTFPSGADWMPLACSRHADALADRYGASVEVLA